MKKIYISHSTDFDFRKELYKPFGKIRGFKPVFPHEKSAKNSKDTIRTCSAVIAEVSAPSHGVGIEVGWANSFGIPVIFIFRKGSEISGSLRFVSGDFLEYDKVKDIIPKLEEILHNIP